MKIPGQIEDIITRCNRLAIAEKIQLPIQEIKSRMHTDNDQEVLLHVHRLLKQIGCKIVYIRERGLLKISRDN